MPDVQERVPRDSNEQDEGSEIQKKIGTTKKKKKKKKTARDERGTKDATREGTERRRKERLFG